MAPAPPTLPSWHYSTLVPQQSPAIRHVVIIVQENRSVDDLFNGLTGADTVRFGFDSRGRRTRLEPTPLNAPFDISHRHSAFKIEYNNGHLNGFNLVDSNCRIRQKCPRKGRRSYGYVPHAEVKPYFELAMQYAFADRMFQTNQGPSFPAHQYLLSGTSTIGLGSALRAAENPLTRAGKFTGGCSSPPGSLVLLIDQNGRETDSLFPCFDRPSITDLLQARGLSWRYYQSHPRAGLWNGPDAIRHIQESHDYHDHVVLPPARVLKDIAKGRLADVSWVTPTSDASDHAGGTDGDARSDDLSDCFNFSQRPRRFTTIDAPLRADYFLRHADSTQDPDDDR